LKKFNSIQEFKEKRKKIKSAKHHYKKIINLCGETGCIAIGAKNVQNAFEEEIKKRNLDNEVLVKVTGCHGYCQKGPICVIEPGNIFYPDLTTDVVPEIIEKTIINDQVVDHLLYSDPINKRKIEKADDILFYSSQTHLIFRLHGIIDPMSLDDYITHDGYAALARALSEMSPEDVINEVRESGLRGRGGAGFPTGIKWNFCRNAKGDDKYVICNADEGDPGAFMDRSVLEGTPHAVLEGMIIAGYAIGATLGMIYVRAEYPLAILKARNALKQAKETRLLGEDILGTGFDFDIEIREGAGAFVCGEETALIASLEGKRGMPNPRPPFPAVKGYEAKPTNINNVETFANVPLIILRGKDWYKKIGTETSKGTKIFALAGKVNNTGLVEVPMGTTLREIIYDIGGGIPGNRKFKAAQMGGPSGGFVPAQFLDLPIDYESVKEIGAIMGSGGLIIMDENTCIVDIARYFIEFVQKESCGKCTPCSIGTKYMLDILERITAGKGCESDLEELERLSYVIKDTSLCGLGKTAPNPVLSTLRYFREEYEEHINKKCPAFICKSLFEYKIVEDKCTACGKCRKNCAYGAILGEKKVVHKIINNKCTRCGTCYEVCSFDSIIMV
jgi:NADH:ubiquinone oxidoreductase subunit F (NADH-binding)/(2Fe-2S) ferredoxin